MARRSCRARWGGRSSDCRALAVLQLVPLPQALHHWIAPGSADVWHPDVPAAAAILGPGPHPISLYPEATRRWLAFATGLIALALAAAPALRHRHLLLRASIAVVTGAVFVSAYAFVARLVFGDRLFGTWTVPTVAPFGPFVSKNHFAGYVELAALLAVGLATGLADEARHGDRWLSWIEGSRAKWIVVAWGAALVLVLAVPVSLSRGGVVSLSAGLACFVLLRFWARRGSRLSGPALVGALAGLGATGLLIVAVLPTEARARVLTLTGITSDQSGSYRLALWGDTLRLATSSLAVGSGFGAYEDALPRFKTTAGGFRVTHAESDHLELLAEGGLVAALLGAGAVLALLLLGLKALRATKHRLARSLLGAALAGGAPSTSTPPSTSTFGSRRTRSWPRYSRRSALRPFCPQPGARRRAREAFNLSRALSSWRLLSWPPSPPRGSSRAGTPRPSPAQQPSHAPTLGDRPSRAT